MSKDNYKVYVHINKINGKRYYGITRTKVEQRWQNGKGYKNNEYFTKAINKYGWDNFEHIVIAKGLTEEEAKWLEIELIREFDTTNRDKGYNITLGGEGGNGAKRTEETRRKISENHANMKGENNPMYGKTHTEEARKKISEAQKGKNTGKNNPRATKVYCVELDMYFDSITEASEYVDCDMSNISQVLTGGQKTAKGYHWLFAEDVNKENINRVMSEEKNILKGENHPNAKAICCIELDMYFDTVRKASEYIGCSDTNISQVLTGRNKTAKGYHFIYAEDVEIENNKVS